MQQLTQVEVGLSTHKIIINLHTHCMYELSRFIRLAQSLAFPRILALLVSTIFPLISLSEPTLKTTQLNTEFIGGDR